MVRWLLVALFGIALSWSSMSARADEEKVSLDKLPKAVAEAIKKKFPQAKLLSASKESEDRKTLYEVQIQDGDVMAEVTVTPEGEITEIEKEIPVKDLPKAVREALDAKYSKAVIRKVEEETERDKVTYEVWLVTAEKQKLKITFDAKGKVLDVDKKGKEKD